MKRQIIRVEPLASLLDKYNAPKSTAVRHGDTLYVTAAPPFEPDTGEICKGPGTIVRQTELVLEQMKLCLETAGSSLDNVLKCNVYCAAVESFGEVNEVYRRYFPKDPPAHVLINVRQWNGGFDIEMDCIAAV
jgi:2-iminobutanoate/2-iminopropanoate deaminase